MKIAIFTETFLPQINGVVRTLEKVVMHLERRGHEVIVFTIGDENSVETYSNSDLVRVEGIQFKLYPELYVVKPEGKWQAKLLTKDVTQVPVAVLQALIPSKHSFIEDKLKEFKPDLIHLATPVTLGAVGLYYVDELDLPCLATFHTDLAAYAPMYQLPYMEEITNAMTKMTYNRANRTLAPSPSSQAQLEKIGTKNVGVFGRGVDAGRYDPAKRDRSILEELGLDANKTTMLYVGRLAEEKSLEEVVNAFKEHKAKHDIQLVMVGDGPIKSELEESLQDYDGVAFTGIKKGEELAKIYASCDIFSFASKTETFGQVVLEAMASGLAVVGYDSPGVRDLVKHAESGILAQSLEEFSDAIKQLIESEELRSSYSQVARDLAQERSWDNILDALLDEYNTLIEARSPVVE